MLPRYTTLDTVTGEYATPVYERFPQKAINFAIDYCNDTDVACRVDTDENGNEVLVPLHRKRTFKAWQARK